MDNSQFGKLLPGKWYELALFIYTLINNQKKKFDLGREIKCGGKWDDLVIKVYENSINLFTFLQIKLVDDSDNKDNFVDSDVLIGKRKISLKDSDFKLQKYFISYLRIKDQLNSRNDKSKIQKLIVFTNAHLNINDLQQKVGTVICRTSNKNDVIPNTDKDLRFYYISNVQNTFARAMKNIKTDCEYLAEELASYATNTKVDAMTLEKDYIAYYHTSLLDEKVIEIKAKCQGVKTKRAIFTKYFIDGQGLSTGAQKLHHKLLEIVRKKGYDVKNFLVNMKATEWVVSEDFDVKKSEETIFLPNYKDISDKDVKDFFGVLEFRVNQLAVKELLSRIKNVEIKNIFLEYYNTDPKIVEFLINDFILCWKSKKTIAERWILHAEKSIFITELKSRISKPKVIYKTQNHINYLKTLIERFGLVYSNNSNFNNSNFRKIFNVIKTSSIILTSVKMVKYLDIIQRNDYIFIDVDNLLHQREIIKLTDAFESNDFNLLILSFKILEDSNIINELFSKLSELTKKNKGKKIIIITNLIEDSLVKNNKELHEIKDYVDNLITLPHLEDASNMIKQKITIQGQVLELNDFISEAHYDMVGNEILEHFIYNGDINIGNNPLRTSYLEGAYTELYEEVQIEALVNYLSAQESDDIFIISCISRTNVVEKLIRCLTTVMTDANIRPNFDIRNKIGSLNLQDISNSLKKRVQVTDHHFTQSDFKKICHIILKRKINWMQLKQEENVIKFILLQIYNPDFYLKGDRFNTEVVIEKNIKKELVSDTLSEIYIVSGKHKSEFESWLQLSDDKMQFQENYKSDKIRILPSRENGEITFQKTVQVNLDLTIHLLSFKRDQLVWYKTQGSIKKLCQYRAGDHRNTKPMINEDNLIQEIKDKKAIIIAGDPGMGKSTTLVKLYESQFAFQSSVVDSIIKSHWLIRVNLKDHIKIMRNIDYGNNIWSVSKEIARFLLQIDENSNNFATSFLAMALLKDNFKKPILVVLDGFDEIIDESIRNKIIMLLKYLNNKTKVKIWITCRHHYQNILESILSSFAIKIEGMRPNEIRKFIKTYLKNNLSLIISHEQYQGMFGNSGNARANSKIDKFTEAFLHKMQEIFKGDVSKFIGTPLQLYLMLENSSKHFKESLINDNSEVLNFSYLGSDLWTIYESFINRKCEIYFQKAKTKVDLKKEQDKIFFDRYHRNLSKAFINISIIKKSFEQFRDIILSVGIVRSYKGDIEFVHPTFREYFVVKEVISWIEKWRLGNVSKIINFEKQKFLLHDILIKFDYKVVRQFLNAVFLKENYKTILLQPQFYDPDILFVASRENNVGIASFVLDNVPNADVNPRDRYKESALEKAASTGNLEMVQFLIEKGSSIKDDKQSVLHSAVSSYNLKLVEYLLDNGADFNDKDTLGRPVLQIDTSLEIFRYLIEKGADVDSKNDLIGLTLIQSAADWNHFDKVKHLIDKGAKVNVKTTNGVSVLHSAAASENLEMVKLLVNNGADVRARDDEGRTVLHFAAEFGNQEIVEFLLEKEVDVLALNKEYCTALHCAARSGKMDIVKFLIEKHNMDANSRDRCGRTVLHYAVESDNLSTVKFVVKYVQDVNFKDENGRTALHHASASGNNGIITLLLALNGNITLKDSKGQTALDLAKQWRQEASVAILQQIESERK